MRKQDTFFQYRRGYTPILLKVLDIVASGDNIREICKVRWYVIGKESVSTSVFEMATVDGGFANLVPIPRKVFAQAVKIMKDTAHNMVTDTGLPQSEQAGLYCNAKRRALRLLKKELGHYFPKNTVR